MGTVKGPTVEFKTVGMPQGFDPVDFVTQAKEQNWNVSVLHVERREGDVFRFDRRDVGFDDPASLVKRMAAEGWELKAITIERYWLCEATDIDRERRDKLGLPQFRTKGPVIA